MEITFNITPELSKLSAAYSRVGKSLQQVFRDMVSEFSLYTESYSKQVTPVKTGRLRGSIATVIGSGDLEARVGTWDVNYSIFVHEGTRYMRARPFMRWGLEYASNKFNDKAFSDRIDEGIRKEMVTL